MSDQGERVKGKVITLEAALELGGGGADTSQRAGYLPTWPCASTVRGKSGGL